MPKLDLTTWHTRHLATMNRLGMRRVPSHLVAFHSDGDAIGGDPVANGWKVAWGAPPQPEEIERVSRWLADMKGEYEDSPNPEVAARILRQNIDVRIIFLLDKKFTIRALGNAESFHDFLAGHLRRYGETFFAEVLGCLLRGDFTESGIASRAAYFESAVHISNRFFHGDYDRIIPFYQSTGLAELFIECVNTPEVPRRANREIVGRLFAKLFVGGVRRPAAPPPGWRKEWGTPPTADEIQKARAFLEANRVIQGDGKRPTAAQTLLTQNIDLRALYLVDRQFTLNAIAYVEGNHIIIADWLKRNSNEGFWAEIIGGLLQEADSTDREEKNRACAFSSATQMLYGIYSGARVISAFIRQHRLAELYLRCGKNQSLLALIGKAGRGTIISFIPILEKDVQADCLAAARTQPVAAQVGQSSSQYDPASVGTFLETVPEKDRPIALATMGERAGLIVRSAIGRHTEISNAVNAMPRAAAAALITAELKLTPDDLLTDPAKADAYRKADNFGALKCCFELQSTETGATVVISPVFDALSPEGKAKFFRVFRIYCLVVNEMFTGLLLPALTRKVRDLPKAEYEQVVGLLSPEVRTFLVEKGIVPAAAPTGWVEPEYSVAAKSAFVDQNPPGTRAAAFKQLYQTDLRQAGIIARTANFHDVVREMFSGLTPAELANLFDQAIVRLPSFEKPVIERFDALDSGAMVRGLCLLPQETVEAVLNQVQLAALSRIFDQAYIVSGGLLPLERTRTYVGQLLGQALTSPIVDKAKVAAVLNHCQPESAGWVRAIYQGKLDVLAARAEAESKYGVDERLRGEITGPRSIASLLQRVKPLAEGLKPEQQGFPDLSTLLNAVDESLARGERTPEFIRNVGLLWDAIEDHESLAAVYRMHEYLSSRELFLLRRSVEQVIDWLALKIFRGEAAGSVRPVFAGKTIAQLMVVEETEEFALTATLASLQKFQLPVTRNYPTGHPRTAPVAAIITSEGGGDWSHDTMRAKDLQIPLGQLPGANRLLKPFHREWVTLDLGEAGGLRLATADEVREARVRFGLIQPEFDSLGPKGKKLLEMSEKSLPVPPARFLRSDVTWQLYDQLGLQRKILQILGDFPLAGGREMVLRKLERVREVFLTALPPTEVTDVLLRLNQDLPGEARIFRPTMVLEDRPDFAGAGYLDSPVSSSEEQAVVRAMMEGWASYWNELPFMARVMNGLDHFAMLPGAVLMQLIIARAAGNMVVNNPDDIIISAVYGQGQGAMTEKIPTDTVRVQPEDQVNITPAEGRQHKIVYSDGRLVKVDLAPAELSAPAIGIEEARQLAKQGRELYRLYGPQARDVEWVIDQQSGLWIVQDRGIER